VIELHQTGFSKRIDPPGEMEERMLGKQAPSIDGQLYRSIRRAARDQRAEQHLEITRPTKPSAQRACFAGAPLAFGRIFPVPSQDRAEQNDRTPRWVARRIG